MSTLGQVLIKLSRKAPRGRGSRSPFTYTGLEAMGTGFGDALYALKPGESEDRTKKAMVAELERLGALTQGQLDKLAAEVSSAEAAQSLRRLRKLEKSEPSKGELARGALVGSVVGPAAVGLSRAIAGKKAAGGLGVYRGVRDIAASAGSGAIYGGALPAGRHMLEEEVEKQKLREYVGERQRGTLRGKIKKTLGV